MNILKNCPQITSSQSGDTQVWSHCWSTRGPWTVTRPLSYDAQVGLSRVCVRKPVAQSCLTLCNPTDCSSPSSSVHAIFQARILSGLPFPSPGCVRKAHHKCGDQSEAGEMRVPSIQAATVGIKLEKADRCKRHLRDWTTPDSSLLLTRIQSQHCPQPGARWEGELMPLPQLTELYLSNISPSLADVEATCIWTYVSLSEK